MKRILKITASVVSCIGLLYLGLLVYVKLNGRGAPYSDYSYNVLITRPLAKLGSVDAQYKMGWYYAPILDDLDWRDWDDCREELRDGELEQAIYWFGKAAKQGHVEAQYELGNCYRLKRDNKNAVLWYRKAAEQGHAKAQFRLGVCYAEGDGVEQDYEQAVYWWRKAAKQGHAKAQYNLGVCYTKGDGVEQDYEQVVYWCRKAADQGHAKAQYNLGACYVYGHGVEQDYEQAVYWFLKAAEQGLAEAQFNLGLCYANGDGVERNYEQAVDWFRKAAEQGDVDAQFKLGRYSMGCEQTIYWYRKAAEQGSVDAQWRLGDCYAKGNCVEQDYDQAMEWLNKAAEQRYIGKSIELAEMFENLTFLKQCTLNCGEWSNNAPRSLIDWISSICFGTVRYESHQLLLDLLQMQLVKTNTQRKIVQRNSFALALDTLTVKKYGLKFKNGVTLDFACSFVYPTKNTPEINRIRDLMIQDFFSNGSTLTLSEAIKRYEKATLAEYASQRPNDAHQHSQQYSAVKVVNNRVLIHMMQGFYDWGGVHGVEPFSVGNYDLRKGEKITLAMLFAENTESELVELIKNELDDDYYKTLFIPENFILLPKGILFCYKPYDIAAYALGTIGVPLSYEKIKHLLTPSAHAYFGK